MVRGVGFDPSRVQASSSKTTHQAKLFNFEMRVIFIAVYSDIRDLTVY